VRRAIPVGVTGMGCICAAGPDTATCLRALDAGRREPKAPTRFANGHARVFPVFEVPDAFLSAAARENQKLSRTVHLALQAALEALAQAGMELGRFDRSRIGVCIGTSVGASLNFLDFYRAHRAGAEPELSPISRYLSSNPAQAVARELGLGGPVQTVVNACSSGADAMGLAAAWIRQGLCDAVIAGGADELSEVTYDGFIRLMITDQQPCRPFDRERAGLNLGEGAGMVVLESEQSRTRRQATVLAALLGYGTAADAYHMTAPHPEGLGLKRAVADALDQAGLRAENIAFINAHGTGTPNNDKVEAAIFNTVFPGTPFVATKGVTGHTLGAAGAIEAVFTMAHLNAGLVPASPGHAVPDPELGAAPTTAPLRITGTAALSQSLAFGGNNSVLAIGAGRAA